MPQRPVGPEAPSICAPSARRLRCYQLRSTPAEGASSHSTWLGLGLGLGVGLGLGLGLGLAAIFKPNPNRNRNPTPNQPDGGYEGGEGGSALWDAEEAAINGTAPRGGFEALTKELQNSKNKKVRP